MKIIDKINKLLDEEDKFLKANPELKGSEEHRAKFPEAYYSYEYFPPKTVAGEENLLDRIQRMGATNPLWVDMTWGAGGGTFDNTLDLCGHILQYMGLDVLMHLTCTGMTRERVIEALDRAKEYGIRNILALRGDPPSGAENWTPVDNGFSYATELVAFIKEKYGDYFCIVVAGYPEVHSQATSREDDIKHLKEKCDAGADIVITQLFYHNDIFNQWVKDCRAAGIKAFIIPGLMPILGYDRFQRTVKFCDTAVPESLSKALEERKADDEKVRQFGVEFGIQQSKELIDSGCRFLHYYTMNLEAAVIKVIKGLGIINMKKQLPFQKGTSSERKGEDVRPIFWANKPSSYLQKTNHWDEFPNGRWGPSRSPAFETNDQEMGGFVSYSHKFRSININEKQKQWGASCTSYSDVSKVFINYITGKIQKFPFSEGTIALETSVLTETLVKLNENKLFTINSQPRVNAAPSTDEKFGWGPELGYVYQKAYFELFIHKDLLPALVEHLSQHKWVSYQAINLQGQQFQNVEEDEVNAVTWGVFKNHEIVQPTVVDHQAFVFWKDEALNSFVDVWAQIYKGEKGSPESLSFLQKCTEDLFLVNIVDNDYIGGDLNQIMLEFITKNQEKINAI